MTNEAANPRRHWYEDRIMQARHEPGMGGVDQGASAQVLVELRRGNEINARLAWFKGHMRPAAGVRGFGHVYTPAHLTAINGRGYWVQSFFEEGRISTARLIEHAEKIDRTFGPGTAALIDPRRTLIVVDDSMPMKKA